MKRIVKEQAKKKTDKLEKLVKLQISNVTTIMPKKHLKEQKYGS
jgi:uncharacterized protein YlaN (UPF0358 family)